MKWTRIAILIAILLFFWLAVNTAVTKSFTNDEPVHMMRGYTLWATGDLQYQAGHTPLSHWLIAALLNAEPTLPDLKSLPGWGRSRSQLAQEMFWHPGTATMRVLFLGRLTVIWLGVLLGSMVTLWSRLLWGEWASVIAAILFAVDPNTLGILSLATTDGPLVVAFFTAVFTLWLYQKRPSPGRWLLAGIGLGLALATKISALLLLPITFLLVFSQWRPGQSWKRPFVQAMSLLPLALLVLWALYLFELGPTPGVAFPTPAPTYISNFITVSDHVERGHNSFLMGERSANGWWYYFIIAFLIKTPVPLLILLMAGFFLIIWHQKIIHTRYLWLPAAALFTAAGMSGLNIGYRHIAPILPFLWIAGAFVGSRLLWQRHATSSQVAEMRGKRLMLPVRVLFIGLLVWAAVGTLRQHPHHLAYFNALVGGSENGYQYLNDSNIDWGQDLYLLAAYASRADGPILTSYNGFSDVTQYENLQELVMDPDTGIINDFNPANPAPGRYALSVMHLQGTPLLEPDVFDWFRRQTPIAKLGYSIFIYDVPDANSGTWVGHCLAPTPAVDPQTAESLVGQSGLRHLYFDCQNSWIFPHNGQPGWMIVPPGGATLFSLPLSAKPQTVFVHAATSNGPAYDVLVWPGGANVAEEMAAWPGAASLENGDLLKRPFSIHSTAQFLGYQQESGTWSTAWQVQAKPASPLSIKGHLHDKDTAVAVADGLGFSSEQWEPGDVVVQQHRFEGVETAVFMATGLYEYLSGNALPLANQPDTSFNLSPLP